MAIQYLQQLTSTDYANQRFQVISLVEGVKYPVYLDDKILGYPTIGLGFKIDLSNIDSILEGMQFDFSLQAPAGESGYIKQIKGVINKYGTKKLTATQFTQYKNDLDAIMAARATAYGKGRTEFKYLTNAEVKTSYDLIVDVTYEERVSKWLGENTSTNPTLNTQYTIVPKGYERLALLSLCYNGYIGYDDVTKKPVGSPSLRKALLVDGNRAEAWYQIRYNTPSSKERLTQISYLADMFNKIKRNFFESELLGLYDDPNNVGTDEAKQVYRMLQTHRQDILTYEALHGPGGSVKDTAGRTGLEEANYNGANGAQSLTDSLNTAKTALFTYLQGRNDLPDLANKLTANNISSVNIYLNPHKPADTDRSSVLDSFLYETGQYEDGANDLMIGMDQGDYMLGHKGDDILIGEGGVDLLDGGEDEDVLYGGGGDDYFFGGEGNDVMYGGADDDTYFIEAGEGTDTIEDKEGINKVILCGKEINFFYDTGNGEYKSPDGGQTIIKSTGLVTDVLTGTMVILNDDFQWGDFGATLVMNDLSEMKTEVVYVA
ncbi:MAG: hypothetical protein ABIK92_03265 [Pseudomonadota bacterium]